MRNREVNNRSALKRTDRWNVFVSYHHEQKWWVRKIVAQFETLNLRVFFDESTQRDGEVVGGLTNHILNSQYMVVVITPESVKSEWVNMEIGTWLNEHPTGDGLIPAVLDHVAVSEIPNTIRRIHRRDLTGKPHLRKLEYHRLLKDLGVKRDSLPAPPAYKKLIHEPSKSFCLAQKGKALAIGAHWDDIFLGCFGTLLKLRLIYGYEVKLYVLCTGYGTKYYGVEQGDVRPKVGNIYRALKEKRGINYVLHEAADQFKGVIDRRFHDASQTLHGLMKEIAHEHEDFNLIFTPPMDDGHEDHAFTGQLVFSYFRKPHQTILEYEIKRYLEKHFIPNVFMSLDDLVPVKLGHRRICIGDHKNDLLSRLVTNKRTGILGSEFLFSIESLRARLTMQALNYGGDKNVKYGEAFRGRISI